jgi:hypothetical protein
VKEKKGELKNVGALKKTMPLYQIKSKYFTAGLVTSSSQIVWEVPPILRYMNGWKIETVRVYCEKKGWTLSLITKETKNYG